MKRFWDKVDIKGSDDCWEWIAYKGKHGYGVFRVDEKLDLAHRVAWELTNGPIPEGEGYHGTCVCHKCDNRSCVNPNHLFLGSHQDNMDDMRDKGRIYDRNSERNPKAKLSADQVTQIKEIGMTKSAKELGEMFNVSKSCIKHIRSGRHWVNP